jgi:hypothetical protein
MSIITFTPFTTGQTNVASELYEKMYGFLSPSLSVINGELDSTNTSKLAALTYLNVQKGTFSGGRQVGGTATLDFFSGAKDLPAGAGWFSRISDVYTVPNSWLHIPGATTTAYIPYQAHVLIFWSITWANDSQDYDDQSVISLFVDDVSVGESLEKSPCSRRIQRSQFGNNSGIITSATDAGDDAIMDRYKGRTYSGHYATTLEPGFHNISMKICATGSGKNKIKNTKIRARSLKYIYFREGATF